MRIDLANSGEESIGHVVSSISGSFDIEEAATEEWVLRTGTSTPGQLFVGSVSSIRVTGTWRCASEYGMTSVGTPAGSANTTAPAGSGWELISLLQLLIHRDRCRLPHCAVDEVGDESWMVEPGPVVSNVEPVLRDLVIAQEILAGL
jgi:hypothetical protein